MSLPADFPETYDYSDTDTVYPMTLTVGAKAENEEEGTSPIAKLLNQYSEHDPGIFSIGGTFGIDAKAFQAELNSVYVSVVNVRDDAGELTGKLLVVQGIAYFRIGKIITISATLLGEYDPDTLSDPLELFNKEPETDNLGISDALSFGQYDTDVLADASTSALAELDDKSAWQALTLA